jgi:tetratricopeptide (TPR) repeat protein
MANQTWTPTPAPPVSGPGLRSERRGASHALAKAVSLHLDGKPAEALAELYAAIDRGDKDAEVYSALGHIHFQLSQFEEAATSYWKLLQLEPAHRTASFNLAVCLEKLGRWDEACEKFTRALDADPQRNEAFLGIGICNLQLGRLETALEAFDKCLNQSPSQEALVWQGGHASIGRRLDEAAFVPRNLEAQPAVGGLAGEPNRHRYGAQRLRTREGKRRATAGRRPDSPTALEGLAAAACARGTTMRRALLRAAGGGLTEHFEGWFNLRGAPEVGRYRESAQAYQRRPPCGRTRPRCR